MRGAVDGGLETIAESAGAVLRSGLSVAVVSESREHDGRLGPAEPCGGTVPHACGERGPGRGCASVLVTLAEGSDPERRASRRMRLSSGRRSLLLSLSTCLAECAMDLGLGASVCRHGVSACRHGAPEDREGGAKTP